MKQELQNELFEKYPNLFSNKDKGIMQSCMSWGIECDDGWYDIIRSVCWQISQHEKNIQEGFSRKKEEYQPVKFDQIKEKFGGLRIYFSGGDEFVEGIVNMAEEISYKICEVCGNKGKPNEQGWIKTCCELHK